MIVPEYLLHIYIYMYILRYASLNLHIMFLAVSLSTCLLIGKKAGFSEIGEFTIRHATGMKPNVIQYCFAKLHIKVWHDNRREWIYICTSIENDCWSWERFSLLRTIVVTPNVTGIWMCVPETTKEEPLIRHIKATFCLKVCRQCLLKSTIWWSGQF